MKYFNHVFDVSFSVDINSIHEDAYDATQFDKAWLMERIGQVLDIHYEDLSDICQLSETIEHTDDDSYDELKEKTKNDLVEAI